MQTGEWKIRFGTILWIIAFIIIGAYLIYRGVILSSLLEVLGGVVLLLGEYSYLNIFRHTCMIFEF